MKKIILFVLVLISFFMKPSGVFASVHSLSFTLSSVSLNPSETKTVPIYMYTGGERVIGVDVKIKYDPNVLSVVDIEKRNVFENEMAKVIDNTNGVVQFSYANSYNVYTAANDVIAFFTFQARSPNSSSVSFVFEDGNTKDTNMVNYKASDILTEVGNMTVTVLSPTPTPTSVSTTPDSVSSSPNSDSSSTSITAVSDNVLSLAASPSEKNREESVLGITAGNKKDIENESTANTNEDTLGRKISPVLKIGLALICGVCMCLFIYFAYKMQSTRKKRQDKV